ncbi:MAG: hypothetical protein CR982_02980 [Candidatus Cloacimonadota bacterium]|nr:MAG: hypothetical protein CR982_02980 [Candidatus Cloacimonadota bacterium]PIE82029.1 MAG: hypothetical protein CSA15_00170 [Candidatus Delongbacteria bacterium]
MYNKFLGITLFLLFNNLFSQSFVVEVGGYIPTDMSLKVETNIENYSGKKSETIYTAPYFQLSLSYLHKVAEILEKPLSVGFSIGYEGEARSIESFKPIGFSNIPLVAVLSYDYFKLKDVAFSSRLSLGYNIIIPVSELGKEWDRNEGGVYFSLSTGITFSDNYTFFLGFSNSENIQGEDLSNGTYISNIYSHSKVTISLGKSIDF